jgi:dihydropteroate synthase
MEVSVLRKMPKIMGILNFTPDSFSDGGSFFSIPAGLEQARRMAAEGADFIDIGGESTRPGAKPVSAQEELDRVIPLIQAIRAALPTPISIDTSKPEVMLAALQAGASFINDVYALRAPGALQVAAAAAPEVEICLMHMQGEPRTMQQEPRYADVVSEVREFLAQRVLACEQAGIAPSRIYVDPGFGFGKTLQHNLCLIRNLHEFASLGSGVLVGVSRKSMIGAITGKPVGERLYGGLALAVLAAAQGAAIIRTHDVAATREAMLVAQAVLAKAEGSVAY